MALLHEDLPDVNCDENLPSLEDQEEEELQVEPLAPEGFSVTDEASANWVLRKIAEARTRKERMVALRGSALVEAKSAEREAAFFLERFSLELQAFATGKLALSKKKSFRLLEGTLGFRKKSEKFAVEDPQAALEWARTNCPDAITVTPVVIEHVESVDAVKLEAHFKALGEVPDGCCYTPEREEFYVK